MEPFFFELDFSIFDFAGFIRKTPQLREKLFSTFGTKQANKDGGEELVIKFDDLGDVLITMIRMYLLQHSAKKEIKPDDKRYESVENNTTFISIVS